MCKSDRVTGLQEASQTIDRMVYYCRYIRPNLKFSCPGLRFTSCQDGLLLSAMSVTLEQVRILNREHELKETEFQRTLNTLRRWVEEKIFMFDVKIFFIFLAVMLYKGRNVSIILVKRHFVPHLWRFKICQ